MTLKHGSLFSGVGMIDRGLEVSPEIKTVFHVEINPYCQAVLTKHWPDVKNYGDIKECRGTELGYIDILSGGFPCTAISGAGRKKLGIGTPEQPTTTSGLWFEFLRLIQEIRPSWVLVENVARLFTTDDGDRVLSDLEKEGYAWGATLLESKIVGVPHSRPRVWIIACNNYPFGDGDTSEGMGFQGLLTNFKGAFEEGVKKTCYWKRQLGTGNVSSDGDSEQSQSAAYSEGVRRIHDDSYWVDRIKCCGNSVVWIIPALIGAFIVQVEKKRQECGIINR